MRRGYQVYGSVLLMLYALVEVTGWEAPWHSARGSVPASARNVGGYRSFHFWAGGK